MKQTRKVILTASIASAFFIFCAISCYQQQTPTATAQEEAAQPPVVVAQQPQTPVAPPSAALHPPSAPPSDAVESPPEEEQGEGDIVTAPEEDPAFDDIVRLVKSGADKNVLISYINAAKTPYSFNADELAYLRDLGVVPDVLKLLGPPESQPSEEQPGEAAPPTEFPPEEDLAPEPPPPPVEPVPPPPEVAYAAPVPTAVVAPPPDYVTVSTFYAALSPYGNWVYLDNAWCWQPTVLLQNPGWQPYCNDGSWLYSDCGWAWNSSYSWGWAPFHYGRWSRHSRFGWLWRPDTVWGPAWVCWRQTPGVIGWAPLPWGSTWNARGGFLFNGSTISAGFDFGLGADLFIFINESRFCDRDIHRFRFHRDREHDFFGRSTVIRDNYGFSNNRIINHGPPLQRIRDVTHRDIREVRIVDRNLRPGQKISRGRLTSDTFSVYRPSVKPVTPRDPPQIHKQIQTKIERQVQLRETSPTRGVRPGVAVRSESERGSSSRAATRTTSPGTRETPRVQPGKETKPPVTPRETPPRVEKREAPKEVPRVETPRKETPRPVPRVSPEEPKAGRVTPPARETPKVTPERPVTPKVTPERPVTPKAPERSDEEMRRNAREEAANRIQAQQQAAERVKKTEAAARERDRQESAAREAQKAAEADKAAREQAAAAKREAAASAKAAEGAATRTEATRQAREEAAARAETTRSEAAARSSQARAEAQARIEAQRQASERIKQEEKASRQAPQFEQPQIKEQPQGGVFQGDEKGSTTRESSERGRTSRGRR